MSLAAGEFSQARQWAEERTSLRPWVALVDIADPERRGGRSRSLGAIEDLAVRGRSAREALHKLATVLDALDIDVPIQMWDAANRTPQPSSGYLPETGILADLAQSSRRNDAGRTILLVMRTLGPGVRRRQPAGARRCDPGAQRARSRSGRTPAGLGGAAAGLAARGGQLTMREP